MSGTPPEGDPLRRELTVPAVRALSDALGLPIAPDDLAEVTHRLNAFIQDLAPLGYLPAAGGDPVPAPVDPDRTP